MSNKEWSLFSKNNTHIFITDDEGKTCTIINNKDIDKSNLKMIKDSVKATIMTVDGKVTGVTQIEAVAKKPVGKQGCFNGLGAY